MSYLLYWIKEKGKNRLCSGTTRFVSRMGGTGETRFSSSSSSSSSMATTCPSPWCTTMSCIICTGWLGVKHQVITTTATCSLVKAETFWNPDPPPSGCDKSIFYFMPVSEVTLDQYNDQWHIQQLSRMLQQQCNRCLGCSRTFSVSDYEQDVATIMQPLSW